MSVLNNIVSFFKDKTGQGALEYILIIGAAVLIAAIVIAVLVNTSKSAKGDVNNSLNVQKDKLNDLNNLVEW